MSEQPKQNADQAGGEVERDGFTAEELAQQSIYEDSTLMAREMLRGGETDEEAADDKDVAGKAKIENWDQRQVQENKREE